jgi:hypothetical protein
LPSARPVAATVPMEAFVDVSQAPAAPSLPEVGAPTVRIPPRPRPRRLWVGLAAAAGGAILGAGVWVVITWDTASLSSNGAGVRHVRPPAPRPKR